MTSSNATTTQDTPETQDTVQAQLDAAVAQCLDALEVEPANPQVIDALDTVLKLMGRQADLEPVLVRALQISPQDVPLLAKFGLLLRQQGRYAEALEHLDLARRLAPLDIDLYVLAAEAAIHCREHERAEEICQQGLALEPPASQATLLASALGTALHRQTRSTEAIRAYRQAMAWTDTPSKHLLALSLAQSAAGDLDDARDSARQRLRDLDTQEDTAGHDAERADCLYQITYAGRCTADMPERAAVDALLERLGDRGDAAARARFASGKIHADAGDHDAAFADFARGKAIRKALQPFDLDDVRQSFDALRQTFTADRLEALRPRGNASERPVFIVGMPRSGTTLVEQILASHPQVHANGELDLLNDLALSRAPGAPNLCSEQPYPGWLTHPEAGDILRLIAAQYLFTATRRAGRAIRATDKMPLNFRHIGLIATLFPNAHIIHVRRNPMDTCLGCFTTLFAGGNAFTNDLADVGGYYRLYHDLMAHWQAVLPGQILTIDYETLVETPENEAHRLVEAVNLPWDDACLRFEGARRGVLTASAGQVRQGIYKTSVGRAQAYEAHLGPLRDALGDLAS